MKTAKSKVASALPKLTPIILLFDNLLKVHKLIDLNSVDFQQGKQFEETPSFSYTQEKYELLLDKKIKFRVECNVNIDPENLRIACEQHDFGSQQWYTPKYMDYLDDVLFDVKLRNPQNTKVKYFKCTLTELVETYIKGQGLELQQLSGGRLTAKQAKQLGLTLVDSELFAYYQAK